MAVSYKGLVIKFGGDTSELQSALKKVQSETRNTQADLKAINQSLKFHPGNTDLLAQKVRTLNSAYEETKQRLDAYKQALAQLDAKKSSGAQLTAEEQRQYDDLQRQILKCEDQLESYGAQIKETTTKYEASQTAMGKFGQSLQDNAEKLEGIGHKMTKVGTAATAGFGAVATGAMAAWQEVDEGQDTVTRLTGATGELAESLSQSFKNVARNSTADMTTVGTAIGQVNTFLGLTGEQLEGTSEQFIRFAENCGTDVSSSVEQVSMSMKAFGVDASQTSEVLGVFQTVGQATGIDVNTLMTDVNNNGAALREMGLSLSDSVTLLGNFEAAGIPADQMLAGLKKAAVNCAKSGTDLGTTMTDLAARLQDPATQAQATQDAIDLFGSKSALSFIDAAQSGRLNLSDLGTSLDEFAGKVDETFEATQDPPDRLKVAMNNLKITGSELASRMLTDLEPAINGIVDTANRLLDAWESLSPEQQDLAAKVVMGGIAFGALTTGMGKALESAGAIGEGFSKTAEFAVGLTDKITGIGGGWTSFTGLIAANPIGLGVVAVAAAAAGLVWFFTQTETGKQMWADFTGFLKDAWQGVQDFFAGIPEFWGGVWDSVTTKVAEVGENISTGWESLKQGASDAWTNITTTVGTAWDSIKQGTSDKANAVKDAVDTAWDTVRTNTGTAWDNVRSSITGRINDAWDSIRGIPDRIAAAFNNIRISIPRPRLPHFSVSWWDLGPVSLPSISVSWWAKGGILTNPTIFGSMGGQLLGGGEAGPEAVLPIDRLKGMIAEVMDEHAPSQTVNLSVTVTPRQGETDYYSIGQNIGRGVNSVLKQRGAYA